MAAARGSIELAMIGQRHDDPVSLAKQGQMPGNPPSASPPTGGNAAIVSRAFITDLLRSTCYPGTASNSQ